MRIPDEALLPYPANSSHFVEAPGTRPVAGSAHLTGQLPESLPRARPPQALLPERDEHDEHIARDQHEGAPPAQERRHEDRRQKNVPVTLNTRLTRSRRKSASPEVNIEI